MGMGIIAWIVVGAIAGFIATVPGRGYRFIPTFSNLGWDDGPDAGERSEPRATERRSRDTASGDHLGRCAPGQMTSRHDNALSSGHRVLTSTGPSPVLRV